MAKKNTKLAIFVLIAIVLLSLLLYKNSAVTGNYARPTPEACAKHNYPTECSMSGCSWSSQDGCISPLQNTAAGPCTTSSWWQCITSKGCQWANGQCRQRRL